MSSKEAIIKLSSSSLGKAHETKDIHLMPCKIHHNGEAKIEEYFKTSTKEKDNTYKASLRGRILQGEKMSIPSGYCGYVITEDRKPFTDVEDRTFKASQQFSQFTYWNLEDKPSTNDKIVKAMQWIDVSSAINTPVKTDSESENNNTPDTIR